jgi:hypothetical protein
VSENARQGDERLSGATLGNGCAFKNKLALTKGINWPILAILSFVSDSRTEASSAASEP